MTARIDLTEMKRKVYLSYHQDGLIDLLFGFGLLMFGIGTWIDAVVFTTSGWLLFILYQPIKNAVTLPRIGYVEFEDAGHTRKKMTLSMLLGLALLIGILFAVGFQRESLSPALRGFMEANIILIFALMASVFMGFVGWMFSLNRMYIYTGITIAMGIAARIVDFGPGPIFTVSGGIMVLTGLFYLVRFLRDNPKVAADVSE